MTPRSLEVEELGPVGAPEAVVLLLSESAAIEPDLPRRLARFVRVIVIQSPGGSDSDDLNARLAGLGVKRAHLVVIADTSSAASADEVVAYLQQTVAID